jgi:type III secretory pathway component EscU
MGHILKLEMVHPKLFQLTLIEVAGQIYKVKQIYDMLLSVFQVPTLNSATRMTLLIYVISKLCNYKY